MDIKKEFERWLVNATADADVAAELKMLDDTKIEDAFYRDLAFGTGGLRGVIGAGTNRMNVYTVAKASQGLADYLKKNFETPSVTIGYDSRIKSDVFAKIAAGVFAANGVKVNIWPVLMPVPTVSFATRYLHTSAGVMVTASHNPSKYNGYKVYGADGCQITTEAAAEILAEIEKLDIFADVKTSDFEADVANGSIQYIPDEVYTAFVEQVKSQSVLFGEEVNKNVAIVYLKKKYHIIIVGTGAQQLKSLITNEDIEILGRVESMAAYYESADVIIEPVFDGGGMKVKTIEALSFGKVIISTTESLNGYWEAVPEALRGKKIFRCNTADEWIVACNSILDSEIRRYNSDVFNVFVEAFSEDVLQKRFSHSLRNLCKD